MLVLLLVMSTVAALLAPAPRRPVNGESSTTTTTTTTTRREPARGQILTATMNASGARPKEVRLRVGDQLTLSVRSDASDQVRVQGFGLIEAVSRQAPARFDIFADRQGDFPVRLLQAGQVAGNLVVRRR